MKVKQFEKFRDDTATLRALADSIVTTALPHGGKPGKKFERAYEFLCASVAAAFPTKGDGNPYPLARIITRVLAKKHPTYEGELWRPLHWAVELPDIFRNNGGGDAIIGNPPFLGCQKLAGTMGDGMWGMLVHHLAGSLKGSADLVACFVLQADQLLSSGVPWLDCDQSPGSRRCPRGWSRPDS